MITASDRYSRSRQNRYLPFRSLLRVPLCGCWYHLYSFSYIHYPHRLWKLKLNCKGRLLEKRHFFSGNIWRVHISGAEMLIPCTRLSCINFYASNMNQMCPTVQALSRTICIFKYIYWAEMEPSQLLLRQFIVLLYQPRMLDGDTCAASSGMNDTQEKPKYSEKTYSSGVFSTINPTWLDSG
jgi:hypothetical protein